MTSDKLFQNIPHDKETSSLPSDLSIEQKIGFAPVRRMLIDACTAPAAAEMAREMSFSNDFDLVSECLRQTDEMLRLRQSDFSLPAPSAEDISGYLAEIRSEGGYVVPKALMRIAGVLRGAAETKLFFGRHPEFEALAEIAAGIVPAPHILSAIDAAVDKFGELRDNASPALSEVRKSLRLASGSLSKAMRRVLDNAVARGIVSRDVAPSVRDGRMVIPLDAADKRAIPGIVHDSSASGKTVFKGPLEVVETANRIRELEIREHHEQIKVLKALAATIRPDVDLISATDSVMATFDFISAKAAIARQIDGRMPHLQKERYIEWYHAVHPALLLSLRAQGKEVVPLSLTLDDDHRILIVSGPNAGGKSVVLKTVGVVQYMMQCGLLPTVYENSHMGIFDHIFVDIGDEQSIENDLSTYSSHLKNMKTILRRATSKSLLLIDEMGSGTEPQIGGALAQAILAKLASRRCLGVVTTHYQNLKTFAGETEGFVNGAMQYDRQRLTPSFQLSVGHPGSSFAIEIARKTGLDEDVIDAAKEIVGSAYVNNDKYLLDIARDRRYWANKRMSIKEKEAKLDRILEMYEDKSSDLKARRNEIIKQARAEAKEILEEANARIEKTIRDIRAAEAEKERTKELRRELEEYKRQTLSDTGVKDDIPSVLKSQPHKSRKSRLAGNKVKQSVAETPQLEVGGCVTMEGSDTVGRIIGIRGKKAEVAFGALRTVTEISKLKPTMRKPAASPAGSMFTVSAQTSEESRHRQLNFKTDIDVRGMRGDEALQAVTYFLDDATQFGASRLRILHGTGHGILKNLIRQLLDSYPSVKSYADEDVRFGGAGITVVDLE